MTLSLTVDRFAVLISILAFAAGCGARPPEPARWQVGYWYWPPGGERGPVEASVVPDVVYVHVGTLSRSGATAVRWPEALPRARSYVATWRSDEPRPPDPAVAQSIAAAYRHVSTIADRRGQRLAGMQLDVDCPTRSLRAYADLLRTLRRRMPSDDLLSVTALLDWFRPGTRVRDVLAEVDEYVPQFYDTHLAGPAGEIAHPIDAARWAPVFNELRTPYQIGISAFGRIQRVRAGSEAETRVGFRDVTVSDLWSAGLRPRETVTSRTGERLLLWDIGRRLPPALEAGDRVEVVLPTAASVGTAYRSARAFGGWCQGVVVFRWPGEGETLVLTPDEVEDSVAERPAATGVRLEASDGGCRDRACADLRVSLPDRFPDRRIALQVEATTDIDYLVPARSGATLRQVGPRRIDVEVPAFLGERVVPLARVFSRDPSQYALAVARP